VTISSTFLCRCRGGESEKPCSSAGGEGIAGKEEGIAGKKEPIGGEQKEVGLITGSGA
jgi:hypothetical protein